MPIIRTGKTPFLHIDKKKGTLTLGPNFAWMTVAVTTAFLGSTWRGVVVAVAAIQVLLVGIGLWIWRRRRS